MDLVPDGLGGVEVHLTAAIGSLNQKMAYIVIKVSFFVMLSINENAVIIYRQA